MKYTYRILYSILFLAFCAPVFAEKFVVDSQDTFDAALASAAENDTIIWKPGLYQDIFMDIGKSNLVVMAEVLGNTKFTGASKSRNRW